VSCLHTLWHYVAFVLGLEAFWTSNPCVSLGPGRFFTWNPRLGTSLTPIPETWQGICGTNGYEWCKEEGQSQEASGRQGTSKKMYCNGLLTVYCRIYCICLQISCHFSVSKAAMCPGKPAKSESLVLGRLGATLESSSDFFVKFVGTSVKHVVWHGF
jgi:hypothetical protein